HSARVTEAMALSDSTFRKSYRSSYKIPSPSLTLPVRKRYRGDESSDGDDEGHGLDDEGHGLDDKGRSLDDEVRSVDSDGLGLEEEEEVVPEGQQQATPVVEVAASEP
ncbi:hypothetical protein Tco_0466972, partial [Tanacetum coccineum]